LEHHATVPPWPDDDFSVNAAFTALIGALVLKEPLGLKRVVAAIIVAGGIITVSLV
jgi:drug/metabolite transporter (DMT)-like permease